MHPHISHIKSSQSPTPKIFRGISGNLQFEIASAWWRNFREKEIDGLLNPKSTDLDVPSAARPTLNHACAAPMLLALLHSQVLCAAAQDETLRPFVQDGGTLTASLPNLILRSCGYCLPQNHACLTNFRTPVTSSVALNHFLDF